MDWCTLYGCWGDDVEEVIDEPSCDLNCKGCEHHEKVGGENDD